MVGLPKPEGLKGLSRGQAKAAVARRLSASGRSAAPGRGAKEIQPRRGGRSLGTRRVHRSVAPSGLAIPGAMDPGARPEYGPPPAKSLRPFGPGTPRSSARLPFDSFPLRIIHRIPENHSFVLRLGQRGMAHRRPRSVVARDLAWKSRPSLKSPGLYSSGTFLSLYEETRNAG